MRDKDLLLLMSLLPLITPAAQVGSNIQTGFRPSTSAPVLQASSAHSQVPAPPLSPEMLAPAHHSSVSRCLHPSSAGPSSQLLDSKIQLLPFLSLDPGIVAASCNYYPCVTLVSLLFSVFQSLFNYLYSLYYRAWTDIPKNPYSSM